MAAALSTLDEIRKLAEVPENWDGDGAAAVNADSVACAATLWALLSPAKVPVPLIGPNPHGHVLWNWDSLEFEFGRKGMVYYRADSGETGEFRAGNATRAMLVIREHV